MHAHKCLLQCGRAIISEKTMKVLISILMLSGLAGYAAAQSCRPAELHYFVRDTNGKFLTEAQLQKIAKDMPSPAPKVNALAIAADGSLVGYSAKPTRSTRPALSLADAKTCQLKIAEWTLKYHGRTMTLLFDLDYERRAYIFDSLPFRSGTYRLDQSGLTDADNSEIIPASRWKRVPR